MSDKNSQLSYRITVKAIALLASLALLAFFFLLAPPQPSTPAIQRNAAAAAVQLSRLDSATANQILREEAALRDPSPLFLPTPMNSSQAVSPRSILREPGDSFNRYSTKLVFPGGQLALQLPDPVTVPAKPADELGRIPWDRPFAGIGQSEQPRPQLEPREALLEVSKAGNGQIVLTKPLTGLSLPENIDWRPCEFIIQTDATGILGSAPLVQSSGSEAVDHAFTDYLEHHWISAIQKARLPAGLYRIILGP
jgi:hypothetical protein